MSEQFFYLTPDKTLYDFINKCKQKAREICGEQKYLSDSPHLTLYVGDFNYDSHMFSLLETVKLEFTEVKLSGWSRFMDDPVTGGHTLVIEVAPCGLDKLRELQIDVISKSLPFKKPGILHRYRNSVSFDKNMKSNLEVYGFPFVGEIWRAHFTIASFEKNVFDVIWQELKEEMPPESTEIENLSFASIHSDHFDVINNWSLVR